MVSERSDQAGADESARGYLQCLARLLRDEPTHPVWRRHVVSTPTKSSLRKLHVGAGRSSEDAWREHKQYLCTILEAVFTSGDPKVILYWLGVAMWKDVVEHGPDPAESKAWLRAQVAALAQPARGQLEHVLWGRKSNPTPDIPEAWTHFSITPFPADAKPAGFDRLVELERVDNGLIMVWTDCRSSRAKSMRVAATWLPLSGGNQKVVGTVLVTPRTTQYWQDGGAVTGVAGDADTVYIGTKDDGVIVLRGKSGEVWNKDNRLPSSLVRSLCRLRGKVYFWVSESIGPGGHGAMLKYDPHTDAIETLASSKTMQPVSPLEKELTTAVARRQGNRVRVDAMLADEARNCLWMGHTRGLLRFVPDTGQLDTVAVLSRSGNISPLSWSGDSILVGLGTGGAHYALNPSTGEAISLAWSLTPTARFGPADCDVNAEVVFLRRALVQTGYRGPGVLQLRADSSGRTDQLRVLPDGSRSVLRHVVQTGAEGRRDESAQ